MSQSMPGITQQQQQEAQMRAIKRRRRPLRHGKHSILFFLGPERVKHKSLFFYGAQSL